MHEILVLGDIGVTIYTSRGLGAAVAVIRSSHVSGLFLVVQIGSRVALDAVHARFSEMHIAGETFVLAQKFVAYAAAMAGQTVGLSIIFAWTEYC